ncbi:MAG: hypothetical protein ABJE95_19540, partial [Byssovorax sp.]
MIRDLVTAYARTLAGLTADPSCPLRRAAYRDLIAPIETAARASEMERMAGCELVQRGILRRYIQHPLLEQPYRDRKSGVDLVTIALQARAAFLALRARTPRPGDIVIVGGAGDGPEHAWMALDVVESPYPGGGLLVTGLDGGQRDAGGY